MQLTSVSLTNFRNLHSLELQLGPGLTVLHGKNAQGKSNLLEAIYLLAIGKSYRTSTEKELLSWDVPSLGGVTAVTGGVQTNRDESIDLQVFLWEPTDQDSGLRKRIRVNGAPKKASELIGLLNAVLFSSEDIQLVHGAPHVRRRYLDILLSQMSRQYVGSLQRYHHVIMQRNRLLRNVRDGNAQEDELAFWDQSLCEEGAQILSHRLWAINQLTPFVGECFQRLGGSIDPLQIDYITTVPSSGEPSLETLTTAMEYALATTRQKERNQSMTLVGPHRDDLQLSVSGIDMGRYSSRGQARLAALSLRLGEGNLLADRRGDSPILLLDDTLSELDENRRVQVLQESMEYPQTILTTADLSLLPQTTSAAVRYLQLEAGAITK